jgi:hypothetical protein
LAFGTRNATVNVQNVATTGDGADAVYAMSTGGLGKVSITAGAVSTRGASSYGVLAVGGAVDVTTGTVTTSGDRAVGVYGVALQGAATIHAGPVSTQGDHAEGVRGYSIGGGVNITVTGDVRTAGRNAYGVLGFGFGAVSIDNQGSVSTTGMFGHGLYATTVGAPVTVINSGSVTTSGLWSDAILAKAVNAAVSVQSTGTISVSGDFSNGVLAMANRPDRSHPHGPAPVPGDVVVVVADVATSGRFDSGVVANNYTGGAMTIDAAKVVSSGLYSKGIRAGSIGDVTIRAGDVTSTDNAISTGGIGNRDITVTGAISARDSTAIAAYTRGDVTVNVAAGASVTGGGVRNEAYDSGGGGIAVDTAYGVVTINNAGLIATKGDGWTIEASGVASHAVINNAGTIVGAVKLTGGDDTLTNSGVFVATKTSDFGGGDDLFVNTGVLKLAPEAATKGAVSFLNLARFENTGGLIDLRNGHAGDVFTLSGDYVASGDARLGLDVNGTTADKLVIQGTATGATHILLTGNPAAATLLAKPLTLVQAVAGSTGTFTLANPNVGLIHYGLQPDAASAARASVNMAAAAAPVSYSLTASAGAPVYGTLKLEENAQNIWRQSADAVSEQLAAMRGDAWGGGQGSGTSSGYGVGSGRYWVQAFGSTSDRNQTVGGFSASYNQTDAGVQVGADVARIATRLGNVGWGVTAGYTNSQIDSQGGTLKSDVDTFNLGGYAVLNHGPYFANALVKFDRHQISTSNSVAGYSASFNGSSYGAQFEVGRRFGTDRFAFEPTVSLTYVRTSLDKVSIYDQTLAFDDEDGVSGKIGGRFYSNHTFHNGTTAVFYAGAAAVDDFTGGQKATFYSGGTSQNVSAGGDGAYGQAVLGVSARAARNLTLYLEGDADFGGSRSGAGVRFGARF